MRLKNRFAFEDGEARARRVVRTISSAGSRFYRSVADRVDADDLTQALFAELLERNLVGEADESKGRFRFFLTAVKHFLGREFERRRGLKRGIGVRTTSLADRSTTPMKRRGFRENRSKT